MKRSLSITALLLAAALSVAGGNVTLMWQPSQSTTVTGYRVYSTTNNVTGPWKFERGVSGLAATITNVPSNVKFFAVSATNNTGSESSKLIGEVLLPPDNLQIIEQ